MWCTVPRNSRIVLESSWNLLIYRVVVAVDYDFLQVLKFNRKFSRKTISFHTWTGTSTPIGFFQKSVNWHRSRWANIFKFVCEFRSPTRHWASTMSLLELHSTFSLNWSQFSYLAPNWPLDGSRHVKIFCVITKWRMTSIIFGPLEVVMSGN